MEASINIACWKLGRYAYSEGSFTRRQSISSTVYLSLITLSLILRKRAASYEWDDKEFRINHLLFIDGIILFVKDKDQKDSPVQTVHFFSENIRMATPGKQM